MSNERLDRIEASLEGLNNALNFLVTELIRPSAQQARINYERLDRLESALETLTEQTLTNAEQIAGPGSKKAALG